MTNEQVVAAVIARERDRRDWSTAKLARLVTEAGCPLNQSAVWRIEDGSRSIKVRALRMADLYTSSSGTPS